MPDFTDLMDALGRNRYDNLLVVLYLGLAPGLLERLAGGISVADIGCGSGYVANLMGQAFRRSTFVGYDMSDIGIAVATSEADSMGLANVCFELLDLVRNAGGAEVRPDHRLRRHPRPGSAGGCAHTRQARPGARRDLLHVRHPRLQRLEENIPNRMAPYMCSISVLHCMQVSLAYTVPAWVPVGATSSPDRCSLTPASGRSRPSSRLLTRSTYCTCARKSRPVASHTRTRRRQLGLVQPDISRRR
jgi:SAM-dependent methyltransferase